MTTSVSDAGVLFADGSVLSSLLRSYLAGLTLSTSGASTTMTIAAGQATDSTNVVSMTLAALINKTTSAWAVGNNNGSLDTGAIANNTTYHWFLIRRTDTGVVDVLSSLSATAPTMPTSYTQFRRIASWITNGSAQWRTMLQFDDYFVYDTAILDVNVLNPGITAVTRTLSVPTGINILADCVFFISGGSSLNIFAIFSNLAQSDITPTTTIFDHGQTFATASATTTRKYVKTNSSAQIRTRQNVSGASDALQIQTAGWLDTRGRNN